MKKKRSDKDTIDSLQKEIEVLKDSESTYRSFFENSLQGIYIIQGEKVRIAFSNEVYAKMLGYTVDELLSLSTEETMNRIHPEDYDMVWSRYKKRLSGERVPAPYEFRNIKKDGSYIWVEGFPSHVQFKGKPAIQVSIIDVTDRKTAEEHLRLQNEKLNALHETALDLINNLELDTLLQKIMERAALLTRTEHGNIFLLDQSGKYMNLRTRYGLFKDRKSVKVKKGQGLTGQIWETGKTMIKNDYHKWPERLKGKPYDAIMSTVGVPLKTGKKVIGVIGLGYLEEEKSFTDNDATTLNMFAQLASIALENARLYSDIQTAHDELENRVKDRTAELTQINKKLKKEITQRKKSAKKLAMREIELETQSERLEEINTTLKVLLKQREMDKEELEASILINMKDLIYPYVEQLKGYSMSKQQQSLFSVLESSLRQVVSPFVKKLSSKYIGLTPMEIRITNLIKEGNSNKEMADLMNLSEHTILFHRNNCGGPQSLNSFDTKISSESLF
jgi:PAS domain S-box-containing protein